MRLLLDTQIMLWWLLDDPRLSPASRELILPVFDRHVIETAELPPVHQDPFDRLLIAQARVEGLMAVSADAHWHRYEVSLHRV